MRPRMYAVMIGVLALIMSGFVAAPSQAEAAAPDEISVAGLILVVPREGRAPTADDPAPTTPSGVDVKLSVDDGPTIDLNVTDPARYRSGARFTGSLVVPAHIAGLASRNSPGSGTSSVKAWTSDILAATSETRTALDVRTAKIAPIAAAPARPKAHTVSVVTLGYDGDVPPSSDAKIKESIGLTSAYWKRESAGQVSSMRMAGRILHRTVPNGSIDICDSNQAWDYATGPKGFNKPRESWQAGRGQHLLVVLPNYRCPDSTWWGRGTLGDTVHQGGLMVVIIGNEAARDHNQLFLHEAGHNLSLGHSGQRTCTTAAIDAPPDSQGNVTAPCTDTEYLDYYDVMGGPWIVWSSKGRNLIDNIRYPAALNVTQRVQINALPGGLRRIKPSGGRTQTATIRPADSSGTRGLQITDPATGEKLYVEYRYPTGVDRRSLYAGYRKVAQDGRFARGVRVMRVMPRSADGYIGSTALSRHRRAAPDQIMYWPVGTTATTHNRGISVKVLSANASGVKVRVSLYAPPKKFTRIPTPKISVAPKGDPAWGSVLEATGASSGSWRPGATRVRYQWLRAGKAIPGATRRAYRVSGADVGKPIQVRATGSRSGYVTTSRTSKSVTPRTKPRMARLAGKDRYGTAVAVSQAAFGRGKTAPVVYIATGQSFADALSAAPAASRQGGALLLVPASGTVPSTVLKRVKALAPGRIVIVGGQSAVSDGVAAQIRKARPQARVKRLAGPDRYATSRLIVKDAWGSARVGSVFVATGNNFPDALAASAAAGGRKEPVILVAGNKGGIPASTNALITKLRPARAYVIGGKSAVSVGIEKELRTKRSTVRLAGADRYATAVKINSTLFTSRTVARNYWATGASFPDALGGAVLAARMKAPLYTVQRTCVPGPVAYQAARKRTSKITIFGGRSTLAAGVMGLKIC